MNSQNIENNTPNDFNLETEDDEIDLGEILATLTDNKWLIGSIVSIFFILGVAKALLDTPIYKADAMLQVEEQSPSLGALEPVTALLENKIPVLAEIEIIKSRMVLGEAVKNLQFQVLTEPHYFPVIGHALARRFEKSMPDSVSTPLFGLAKYAWGGEEIQVSSFSVPRSLVNEPLILVSESKGRFHVLTGKEIILRGAVGTLSTKPITKNKQNISLFVSLLKARPGTHFNLQLQSQSKALQKLEEKLSVSEKGKNTGILQLTYEDSSPELAMKVLNEVADIYVRNNVEEKSEEAQKRLEFLEKQLPLIKEQLEAATTTLNEYRTRRGSIDLTIETQSVLEGIVEVNTQKTLLEQKKDELRERFTEWHPSIVAINKQISRLDSQIRAQDKKIQNLPETQQIVLRLSRDVEVNTELYTALLNNAQTLRVAKAGTVGDVRIIDYAVLASLPIKPKKLLIVAISLILGLISGVAVAFIRKALNQGVKDPDLLEKHLNIPVYATIPHSKVQKQLIDSLKTKRKEGNAGLSVLALENKEDLAIESLRSLRTTLHFAFLEAKNNIIMITGPSPSVGKTFVSVNLAAVLADMGNKVLLIDGDLRKGYLHSALGLGRENGLSEVISNTLEVDKACRHIAEINIDFIATGILPPNPSELLLHDRFGKLLEELNSQYDHIIVDSPPVLAVTDASIIGRFASATLLVVKAGQHPMRELEQSVKRFSQAGVNLKGIVFNDIPESSSRYGYGYGKYVYQYNYSKN